ncbi:hypothetical protein ACB092_01G210900 [Castanea dentata]
MDNDRIINSEEYSMKDIDRNLLEWNKWNISTEKTDKIYRQTTFSKLSFLIDYTIKTVERTYSLFNEYETIQLFSEESINQHKEKYAFLHIGLVHVAIKPLTREALNASVLLCLRDDRHLRFNDSLLGMMETSLHNGPVYFNCYPNFALSLTDRNIMDALTLNVKTDRYYMKEGSKPLAIIYRIYYKLMKTTLDPQTIADPSPKVHALLLQASTPNSRLRVPKQIQWKDINLPERWQLEAIAPTPKIENTVPDFIAQKTNGTTQPTPNVHQALYEPQPQPDSPTQIDILGFTDYEKQINVLTKEFVLDKELLRHDYLKPENTNRRKQFFTEITTPSTSIKKENESKAPLFIPHEIPPHLRSPLKRLVTNKTDNLLDEINKKLDLMKLETQKGLIMNTLGRTESSEDEESKDNQLADLIDSSNIANLESQFTDKLQINKLTLGSSSQDRKKGRIGEAYPKKNWYPKPTPPDLQFEERHTFVNSSYSPDLIYEWNIDGMSEYEIINLLHVMTMLTNVYKNHGKRDHLIAHLIVTGFTGQLKSWWDHYLDDEDRNEILTAVKKEADGNVIMTDRQPSQDAVNTLIYTITKHFVGDPNQYKERASDVLINLRYPQLSDFRWYKDVFISKVLSRNDCNQSYWKEKFITGLLYFFAQKVRQDVADNDGTIDYPGLTYGDIISSINKTGLWLCNDLRLKNQIEKEKRYATKELGTFCEQYGFDPLIAPSRKS